MCARGDSTHFACLVRVRRYQSVDSGVSHPPCVPALCHQVEEGAVYRINSVVRINYPHHAVFFPSTHALHLGLKHPQRLNNVSQKSDSTYDLESGLSTDSNTINVILLIFRDLFPCFTRILSLHGHCFVFNLTSLVDPKRLESSPTGGSIATLYILAVCRVYTAVVDQV